MDCIQKRFGRRLVVLPVVHVKDSVQAFRNTMIAKTAKADGVFLISHGGQNQELLELARDFKQKLPGFFIGVNLLGFKPDVAHTRAVYHGLDGLWVDNAEQWKLPLRGTPLMYFGGTAFKTQRHVEDADLGNEALRAARRMDVVCTSGPGTGRAAKDERLKLMADALIGLDVPLAVASGVTPLNVAGHITAGAQAFLSATGISLNFHEFDPELVDALVATVHKHENVATQLDTAEG